MKLDTGMHRLGFRPEEAAISYARLVACQNIQKPINIMSHFSRADEPGLPAATNQQLTCFNVFIKDKPGENRSLHRPVFYYGQHPILIGCAQAL